MRHAAWAVLVLCLGACAGHAETLKLPLNVEGALTQGALVEGQTAPGAAVTLDGVAIRTNPDGHFVIGFGRDHGPNASLAATKDGETVTKTLTISARTYDIQRIEGLPPKQVTPPPEVQARIAEEAKRLAELRKLDTGTVPVLGGFVWPATGRISGVYGSQRILNGEPRAPHLGLDIAGAVGAPVRATATGRVVLADPDLYFTGGTIVIDHGAGVESIYCHLSKLDVKEGQEVAAGDPIGAIGMTGRATGPHLHWGLTWHDERLDPALLMKTPMPASP